jgi:tmRNA-binding protein
MAKEKAKQDTAPVANNKKARHNFEFVEVVEAGIALLGTEVKSLRDKQCDLEGSYARMTDDEVWLVGAKIAPYERGGYTTTTRCASANCCCIRRRFARFG